MKTLDLIATTTTENGNTTIERLQGVTIPAAYAMLKEEKPLDGNKERKIQIDIKRGRDVIDVYSLIRAALHISAGAVSGAKDSTLIRIRAELSTVNSRLALPDYIDAGEGLILNTLLPKICGQEAREIVSEAYNGIWIEYAENISADNAALYSAGYKKVNDYLNRQRRDRSREVSTDYIKTFGGDMVTVNSYVSKIIFGGERYQPAAEVSADISADTRAAIGETLSNAAAVLTLQQKRALNLSVNGCSYSQIAKKMNVSKTTAADHVTAARAKIADELAATAEKARAAGDEKTAAGLYETMSMHETIEKARAASTRKNKPAAENFNAAAESARYTYGKVYKRVEKFNAAAALAAAEAETEKARAALAAAEAETEKARAACKNLPPRLIHSARAAEKVRAEKARAARAAEYNALLSAFDVKIRAAADGEKAADIDLLYKGLKAAEKAAAANPSEKAAAALVSVKKAYRAAAAAPIPANNAAAVITAAKRYADYEKAAAAAYRREKARSLSAAAEGLARLKNPAQKPKRRTKKSKKI